MIDLVRRSSPIGELVSLDASTDSSNGEKGLATVEPTTETARAGA